MLSTVNFNFPVKCEPHYNARGYNSKKGFGKLPNFYKPRIAESFL